MLHSLTISLLLPYLATALSSTNRAACQKPTKNPLQGCPEHTLLVGPSAPFTSIQAAVLSIPNNSSDPYTILILPGTYTEQLNITRPAPLTLLAQTTLPNNASRNLVTVLWRNATGTPSTGTYDNAFTSTLTVAPTLNSSLTGSGPTGNPVPSDTPFGNVDFRAYNINFVNDYLPYAAGPSLALSVSYANAGFYYCQFLSYQDTVYIGKLGNTYMYDCIIRGQTDFFYGFGTLWVQTSLILLRSCGGGITAWKGTNTSSFENKFGVYIHDSHVVRANSSLSIEGKCALGRPWNSLHRSIFAHTYLDESVLPAGYVRWGATDPRVTLDTMMAEYANYGPGWNETARRASNVTRVLTEEEYEAYATVEKVFQYPFSGEYGNTAWIDQRPAAVA